ncbi:MAG: PDZ domain-containing protein [Opitutaceae bacterium]
MELGGAAFEEVEVLLYDCAPLSAHLGLPVDGVLGFPLFRELLLTLDYPGSRLILRPRTLSALIPGQPVPADVARRTPLITVGLGERSLLVLVDSGNAAGFSLNPAGISPRYVVPPREGALLGTLAGERAQRVARLADPLRLAGQIFAEPVVDLTDELSALGGGLLRQFVVTFDPGRDRVFFHRPGEEAPVRTEMRSSGLSFTRTPAYWRVAAVIPGSPAAAAGIVPGELVVRINGEPVGRWDLARFERLLEGTEAFTLTFLEGATEVEARITPFNLLP